MGGGKGSMGGKGGGWDASGGEQMVMVPISMLTGGGFGKGWDKGWGKGWGKGKSADKAQWARKEPAEKKVWIGGFPEGKDKNEEFNKKLKVHMGEGCKYVEVGRKGTGFALYTTVEQVKNAVASLNGSSFEGTTMEVDVWEKQPKKE